MTDRSNTFTLKHPRGPWLVISHADAADLQGQLEDYFPTLQADPDTELAQLVHEAQVLYEAAGNAVYGTSSLPQQQAPAAAAPSGNSFRDNPPPNCQHGAWTFRTGNGARGPWEAWFCAAPKGDPGQCKAIFNNKK